MHVGGFQVGKIVIVHGELEQIMIRTLAVEEQAILLGDICTSGGGHIFASLQSPETRVRAKTQSRPLPNKRNYSAQ
jgi:hypothetical protein